ncbi:orotidine-5'-phosphate decarboxylase [candidate division WOR-3 bacterium]|nr:orotidine-5'-phosphate decarboxylase [candidate division WOR-3 bacterium]
MIEFIFPLDFDSLQEAEKWVGVLDDSVDVYKVGLQLFSREGPDAVKKFISQKKKVFLDLKLHDIPNTVGKAAEAAAAFGVKYLTAHSSGGREMIRVASEAISGSKTKLLAITILTSIDDKSFKECFSGTGNIKEHALKLSDAARESGADGVVCSVGEAAFLRERHGEDFLIITPGIRLTETSDDQRRAYGPKEAKLAKVNGIVMGRPVIKSPDPRAFVESIKEILN